MTRKTSVTAGGALATVVLILLVSGVGQPAPAQPAPARDAPTIASAPSVVTGGGVTLPG
jgi:hypothetical protein